MQIIIDNIIKLSEDIFGKNPNIEKINVGFTNTIYDVDNKFIIKICTNIHNEENFKKEIEFYSNKINILTESYNEILNILNNLNNSLN